MIMMSGLVASSPVLASEGYLDLLSSGPHWLFELTLEVVSAPLVFVVGRAWRNGLLRHLHHDLDTLREGLRAPSEPLSGGPAEAPHVAAAPVARMAEGGPSPDMPAQPAGRVPLSWFSVPFGLIGLAGTWSYAAHLHLVPGIVGTLLGALSAAVWIMLVIAYLRRVSSSRDIAHDLRDPTTGPFAALVLLTPTLLIVQAGPQAQDMTRVAFDSLAVLIIGLAGWLTGQWISGLLEPDRVHPGYFLPAVAGGYVVSLGASSFDQPRLAAFMFGFASISWVLLGAIVLARLMLGPSLPAALIPTLAIQIAPPALASLAWLSLNNGRLDAVASGLAGYGLLMVLAQGPLISTYLRLSFGPGFWAFTFPVTAVATATLHWLTITHPAGGTAWELLTVGAATLLVGLVGARTVLALSRRELRPPAQARFREHQTAKPSKGEPPDAGSGWAA